jgi:hypothetical protein
MTSVDWHHLYGTQHWKNLRAHQLKLHPLCKFCLEGRGLVVAATVADHIKPHHGDPLLFFTSELQSLCDNCHKSRKRLIELHGYDPIIDLDGYPLDPLHPFNRGVVPRIV